jgi:hypothetical protein
MSPYALSRALTVKSDAFISRVFTPTRHGKCFIERVDDNAQVFTAAITPPYCQRSAVRGVGADE